MKLIDKCPCGWDGITRDHAYKHLYWSWGIELPETLYCGPYLVDFSDDWDLWRVRPEDPSTGHKFAYRLARLAQRENGYDFPAWYPSKKYFGEWIDKQPVLYACVVDRFYPRAIAFVVVENTEHYGVWDPLDNTCNTIKFGKSEKRLKIGLVWTAFLWRRRGVATDLIRKIASIHNVQVDDLVWGVPFTEAGKALALSLTDGYPIYVG